jgi:arylsulfatase
VADDFYITDFITEKSIELIRQFNRNEQPFFLYVAHTAPHWPLHARPEDKARYLDRYTGGWEKLRSERYERMVAMGLIDPSSHTLPANTSEKAWDDCKQKEMEADYMATHAAMVDRVDQGVGRIVEVLKETGEFENTVIFVLSDNGASPERGYPPGFDRPGITRDAAVIQYNAPKAGPENTWCYLGDAWANAVNTPFRYWKKESFEGGICTPLIVHWPDGLPDKAPAINRGVAHVMDLLPTCLELSGTTYPKQFRGRSVSPPEGRSLWPLIDQQVLTTHDTLFWEHMGGRALRIGNWKIAALSGHSWELFNLGADRTETLDLAGQRPEKVLAMEAIWMDWAKQMGIVNQ